MTTQDTSVSVIETVLTRVIESGACPHPRDKMHGFSLYIMRECLKEGTKKHAVLLAQKLEESSGSIETPLGDFGIKLKIAQTKEPENKGIRFKIISNGHHFYDGTVEQFNTWLKRENLLLTF